MAIFNKDKTPQTEAETQEETVVNAQAETPAAEAAEAELPATEAADETEKLTAELAEAKDRCLRLMAEYDNFRKRSQKERAELSAGVTASVIGDLLPVYDNFERALATETADERFKQGVTMIYSQFGDALKKLGVEQIDPSGQPFDPNVANAVTQLENDELPPNTVAQVFQKGYRIGDKVIRYAMVAVANP
ncbi:MAG: nucleotide exchange factor GrpE [Oscillospiraceae bacterium]